MDRELVLAVLALAAWVPLVVASALTPASRCMDASGTAMERAAWRRLWLPLAAPALLLALLAGWAFNEPENAELLPWWMLAIGAPFAGLLLRAATRAVGALVARPETVTVATAGLVRPRLVVSARFAVALDREALVAALEHEGAHARHRDPTRLWLARIATDLQWPIAAAQRRIEHWQFALELARDEEARRRGVDGADLAEAILAAVRETTVPRSGPVLGLEGQPAQLEERIARLLAPLPAEDAGRVAWAARLVLGTSLAASGGFGAVHGEIIVRAVLGGAP